MWDFRLEDLHPRWGSLWPQRDLELFCSRFHTLGSSPARFSLLKTRKRGLGFPMAFLSLHFPYIYFLLRERV